MSATAISSASAGGGSAAAGRGRAATGTPLVKRGLAEMLKGGVIMDVVTPEQARIAEDAGAVSVMALERVPSDIRAHGGVSRMSDPEMILGIQAAVSIPVMAKARIGHFAEAQILQALGVDYVDESEVLTPADEAHHIDKWAFGVPFVCGAINLGEALRRISEGACLIRSKGEAGTGNIVEAVRHLRSIVGDIRRIAAASDEAELFDWAKQLRAPPAAGAGGCRHRSSAGAAVLRRRHSDPGRRFAGDAARSRGCVRGLRHLQELGSPQDGQRHRGGGHAFPRSRHPRQGQLRPRQRHEGARDSHTRREAGRPRLVSPTLGVLALQGGFAAHAAIFERLGSRVVEVRTAEQLDEVDALVMPGGESTTISMLLERSGLLEPLRDRLESGLATLGTCAGMILLAQEVVDGRPDQHCLGMIDITVRRNAYGPQIESFEADVEVDGLESPFHAVFIRAPIVERSGPDVEVLARIDGRPVLCRSGSVTVAAFHPELSSDPRIHASFLAGV